MRRRFNKNPPPPHSVVRPALTGALTLALALGSLPLSARPTHADELADPASIAQSWAAASNERTNQVYSSSGASVPTNRSAFPTSFDLRDQGVVTPVKNQSPWGTCWSFSIMGASEISIVSELIDNPDFAGIDSVDLSERHLAWFTYSPIVDGDQAEEGWTQTYEKESRLNNGGFPVYGTSLFSSGIGPLTEDEVPYRNEEGFVDKWGEAYSAEGDWSVDESLRFRQAIELEQSYVLPSPANLTWAESTGWTYGGYSQEGTDAIKDQLMAGRGVSVTYYADQSLPGQVTKQAYMNPTTWAQYTYETVGINHAVTVVGWDDSYPKENFSEGFEGEEATLHTPPADGAWIIKNSWGSGSEDFPNKGDWGIDEDGDGKGDGYFYLSYYDKCLYSAEAFDFYTDNLEGHESYYVNQYDFLPSSEPSVNSSAEKMSMANVFEATGDQVIRTLSCETTKPNTTVTYELYLLNDDASAPTDGTLAATVQKTYEYGGFHRADLSEDQRVAVREGRRFSVVVTQHCNDDGLYYASTDYNTSKTYYENTLAAALDPSSESYQQSLKALRDSVWTGIYEDYVQKNEQLPEDERLTDEELREQVDEAVAQAEGAIVEILEEQIRSSHRGYYTGVVNPGESYTMADGAWYDWAEVADQLEEMNGGIYTYDNFPIKAYADQAELPDVASPESVSELEGAIKTARNDLVNTAISADGTDVSTDAQWVTQDVADAFDAALAEAEAAVSAESPTQADIDAAANALVEAHQTFTAAKQWGTKGIGSEEAPGGTEKPGGNTTTSGGGRVPATGDLASLGAGVFALLASGAGLVGAAGWLRRRG